MKRVILLTFLGLSILSAMVPVEAVEYPPPEPNDDCDICIRFFDGPSCQRCLAQLWWDNGWDCFPDDPGCY